MEIDNPKGYSGETPRKLRFGIMCSGDELPAAFAKCVDEIIAIPGVELSLLIVDATSPVRTPLRQKLKRLLSLKGGLWALVKTIGPMRNLPCNRPTDMASVFCGVPRIQCRTTRKGAFSQYFSPADVAAIREHNLDFILRFAFGIIRGEILNSAQYGVWSFHHGDETKYRGAPPAFWEIYRGDPVTGAILQRLTDRLDGGIVLQRSYVRTKSYSHGSNLDSIMWASTHMPSRVCHDILNGSAHYLDAPPSKTSAPVCYTPNDFQFAKFLLKTSVSWLKNQCQSVMLSADWNIGVVDAPIHAFLDPSFEPSVRWLAYRKSGRYIADPFVLRLGCKTKLLAEEFDSQSGRGSIVETDLDESGGSVSEFRSAIDEGVHMSYPYAFEHNGSVYCTPEAHSKNGVFLYRFDERKQEWFYAATLIRDFAAVDPTPFEYANRWWMFCTKYGSDVESKLYLWHAPRLEGPWEEHVANPVKTDVRSSRPAGRPFLHAGSLYRPAQDSSRSYGGAISINKILSLTEAEFAEIPVSHIPPIRRSSYRNGIHTLVSCGSISVIDGKRYVLTPGIALGRLKKKLLRLGLAAAGRTFGEQSYSQPGMNPKV
jgi:hypothetical protein